MHHERCICRFIPRLETQTRLALVIHYRELRKTTNTGSLAVHALVNSEMIVRGEERTPLDLSRLISDEYESYVLYPSDDAVDIETLRPSKPVQLIVSDGNWRQAGKLHRRHTELKDLPRVKISERNLAQYHLRREHFSEGFSTLEAIAIAFGSLEGAAARTALMDLYQAKLHATLAGRGRQPTGALDFQFKNS